MKKIVKIREHFNVKSGGIKDNDDSHCRAHNFKKYGKIEDVPCECTFTYYPDEAYYQHYVYYRGVKYWLPDEYKPWTDQKLILYRGCEVNSYGSFERMDNYPEVYIDSNKPVKRRELESHQCGLSDEFGWAVAVDNGKKLEIHIDRKHVNFNLHKQWLREFS